MIHAYHVVFGAYGFWMPNDPRGSWSEFVYQWELRQFGPATKSIQRRDISGDAAALAQLRRARNALKFPPVALTGQQAHAVASGFAIAIRKNGYTVYACSILPEHVHLVVARHSYHVEQIVNLLKGAATRRLCEQNLHPLAAYSQPGKRPLTCWAEACWKVYLDSDEGIENAIRYVNDNPTREGKPTQRWSFITPFPGIESQIVDYP